MLSRGRCAARTLTRNARGLMNMVRVVEVGPRDGLQNIPQSIPSDVKINMVKKLADAGLRSIEITSLVPAKVVPQMADAVEVIEAVKSLPAGATEYSVLVPNLTGARKACELGVREVILVTSASEGFARANLNCSVAEAQQRIADIAQLGKAHGLRMRGSVSCAVGCPFDGKVEPARVAELACQLLELGCYEVSIADTIGVGTPRSFAELLKCLRVATGDELWRLAMHCHDTYGQALANILEGMYQGIRVFDSSVAGLGGCPFAPGATGNVATEDLVYLLNGQGMESGVDLDKVIRVGEYVTQTINVPNNSRVGNAMLGKQRKTLNA